MKTIPMKSGGFVNLLEAGDSPVFGQVNFNAKELAWARKIGASTNDPEAEKEFWKTVVEKKLENLAYSVFDDFPEGLGEAPGPSPTAHSPAADDAQSHHSNRRAFNGAETCRQVIEMLKGRGAKTRREREGEAS